MIHGMIFDTWSLNRKYFLCIRAVVWCGVLCADCMIRGRPAVAVAVAVAVAYVNGMIT